MTEHVHLGPADPAAELVDPRLLIQDSPMSRPQWYAVALTGLLSALDGFDLLSVTFVAPALARSFQVESAALGVLLAAGLIGALVGSVTLAPLADIMGRRPIVLISLTIMSGGMLLSTLCTSLLTLTVMRIVTGIGIGAMVVVINPVAVEVANLRMRSVALATMSIGYPLGGAAGGLIAALLLRHFDWRAVFLLGGVVSVLVAPLVLRYLPESLAFLLERRDARSLDRVNAVLSRFGHPGLGALPPTQPRRPAPYREIFRGAQLAPTSLVCLVSLLMFMTIYFFLSWQPTVLVGLGFGVSTASTIAGASSFAGALACAVFAVASRRIDGRTLAVVSILGLGVSVIAFGLVPPSLPLLVIVALLAGGSVAAATVGLYVTAAEVFAPAMRATGTGLVIGVGRVGSALAPAIAGGLFAAGAGRAGVAAAMGACAIVASALLLLTLRRPA